MTEQELIKLHTSYMITLIKRIENENTEEKLETLKAISKLTKSLKEQIKYTDFLSKSNK